MASLPFQCASRQARQLSSRSQRLFPISKATSHLSSSERRSISHTSVLRADDADSKPPSDAANSSSDQDHTPHFDKVTFDSLGIEAQNHYLEADAPTRRMLDQVQAALIEEESAADSPIRKALAQTMREAKNSREKVNLEPRRRKHAGGPRGPRPFFDEPVGNEKVEPEPQFRQDDISSLGHAELERHREIREMYRTAAWEMPLLANLAVPYSEPKRTALPLKFRYTTYLGEHHPAARKVVVEFTPGHLGLGPKQRAKLLKLLGPRYNPHKNLARMSCESHETQAQNKRALGATVAELLRCARGLGPEGDEAWEDVPFHFRHARSRPKHKFPEAWKVDERRMRELEACRERSRALLGVPAGPAGEAAEVQEVVVPAGGKQYS